MSTVPKMMTFVGESYLCNEALAGKNAQFHINPEYLNNEFTNKFGMTDYKD